MKCLKCGFDNATSHKFCCECGTPFLKVKSEAERRSLTVMFCDLAGSTALSEQHDPEELRRIIAAYQDSCRAVVNRYEGFIARYMGDGLLIYFGYPTAHEDDAQRAIRAALEIVDAVPKLDTNSDDQLAVRIGVATGDVVIGDNIGEGAAEEVAVLGMTPNLAARLQSVAEENQIVISEATLHRLDNIAEIHDLGTHKLKGISDPVQAWRVDGLNLLSAHALSAAPFVGRKDKMAQLEAAKDKVSGGQLEILHIEGPPGIGKTRLLHEFLDRSAKGNFEIWSCSAFHKNVPLHPMPSQVIASISLEDEPAESQRQLFFDTISQHLVEKAETNPFILYIEDAHWMDPTTLEYVLGISDRLKGAALLIIIATRPGEIADKLAGEMGGDRLHLKALQDTDGLALVGSVLGEKATSETCKKIVERAGGMPLFLEELANVVSNAEGDDIPDSLQESLLARLDSLGGSKRLAQLASMFGRSFRLIELSGLIDKDLEALQQDVGLLVEKGVFVDTSDGYAFRHALMQEVSYETLLLSTRSRIHGEIADRLVNADVVSSPELIARHLNGAKRFAEAIPYWCGAARHSAGLWAHAEAGAYFKKALRHADLKGDGAWELSTRLNYVDSLRIIDHYEIALVQLDLAENITEKIGGAEDWLRLHVLRGNILFPLGDADRCIQSHEAALKYAKRLNNPEAEARALSGIADAHFLAGKFVSAEAAYDDCVTIAQANGLDAITLSNLSLRGHMRVYLCRIKEAEIDSEQAVEMAVASGNKRAELTAKGSCLGKVYYEMGRLDEADEIFTFSAKLAHDLGTHRFESLNLLYRGKVALERGESEKAYSFGNQAVELARQSGRKFCLPMALGVVARATPNVDERKKIQAEAESIMAEGCSSHNYLWYHRDAILTAIADGSNDDARRYAGLLRNKFSIEPTPWCDMIADGADALADWLETKDTAPLLSAIKRAEADGFTGWADSLKQAGKL